MVILIYTMIILIILIYNDHEGTKYYDYTKIYAITWYSYESWFYYHIKTDYTDL